MDAVLPIFTLVGLAVGFGIGNVFAKWKIARRVEKAGAHDFSLNSQRYTTTKK